MRVEQKPPQPVQKPVPPDAAMEILEVEDRAHEQNSCCQRVGRAARNSFAWLRDSDCCVYTCVGCFVGLPVLGIIGAAVYFFVDATKQAGD